MAVVEENWQTKLSSVKNRTAFVFNNELLSDVKFVVRASNGESESKRRKMVIPAHKFVLAISSPVFFAMFYGQMAETADSIELPDCEYESLLELFRFLYSDRVNLSGSNVMQVLYLANKYMVPSLAGKCTEYLRNNLHASNVFCILPHVRKFEDKDLEDRCWEVIQTQTEEAVTSDEFVTLERSLVECVVKREMLNVTEVELFKAVDHWATKESERQGITTPDGNLKRQVLGEEIVKAIRFPLMSAKEFASVVIDANILSFKEAGDLMKYYTDVLTAPLPFIQTPRIPSFYRCGRFATFVPVVGGGGWSYSGSPDIVYFAVSKPIKLHGVQHFGSEGGEYKVSTVVRDAIDDSTVAKQSATYASEKGKTYDYYGFDVFFDHPVCLEKTKIYKLVSLIRGQKSCFGEEGKKTVKCQGVQFCFRTALDVNENGTCETVGQFPAFLFSERF